MCTAEASNLGFKQTVAVQRRPIAAKKGRRHALGPARCSLGCFLLTSSPSATIDYLSNSIPLLTVRVHRSQQCVCEQRFCVCLFVFVFTGSANSINPCSANTIQSGARVSVLLGCALLFGRRWTRAGIFALFAPCHSGAVT